MHIKILVIIGFILLGIVTFSAYSGYDSNCSTDDRNVTITHNDDSEKRLLDTSDNGVFQEVKLEKSSIEAPESCEQFETITVNPVKFRELASNGTLNLSIMGENYELKLQEREPGKPDVVSYMGYIAGKPQSGVFFTVRNDSIDGCINVDFYTLSYGIASTEEKNDGKIVHLLWRCYNEGAEEEIKKHYSLDPLEFSLTNNGKETHEVYIGLFDFYNQSRFNQTYTMKPEDKVFSPKINVEPGIYRYEIFQDKELICEGTVRADYAAELSSSGKLHINLTDHPEYPAEIEVAVS
jgi:hypothetical protein